MLKLNAYLALTFQDNYVILPYYLPHNIASSVSQRPPPITLTVCCLDSV